MNLLKPTYRLSRPRFFLCTLVYYVATVAVFLIIPALEGLGGRIGPLLGFGLFLVYLHYVVRPRLKYMGHSQMWALTLLTPGLILLVSLFIQWWSLTLILDI